MSIFRASSLHPITLLSLGSTCKNIILKDYNFVPPSRLFCGNVLPQSKYLAVRLPPRTPIAPRSVGFSYASSQLKEASERSPHNASKFKWRSFSSYYNEFKTSPGSHLTSFLILHEITAILPLGAIFLFLQYSGLQPFDLKTLSPETFEVAAKPARYVLKTFGQEESSFHIGSSHLCKPSHVVRFG
ncbi:hypothetical protein DSO57_1034516 [Entomophthora muscae]|uniref:Uncharacterized protein n=1 Tax=Entomophthora muscae TaxID=34485 RepID=A0ACC2UKL0_9FUNG|nr:hypothetical protein DSO57_1034516 [Entomophthora muscae]